MAVSFALYGLIKKTVNIDAVTGLILESSIMSLFSLFYLWHLHSSSTGAFGNSGLLITILLVGAGIVTSIPLLLYSRAINHLPLSMVGFCSTLTPPSAFCWEYSFSAKPFPPFTWQLLPWSGAACSSIPSPMEKTLPHCKISFSFKFNFFYQPNYFLFVKPAIIISQ